MLHQAHRLPTTIGATRQLLDGLGESEFIRVGALFAARYERLAGQQLKDREQERTDSSPSEQRFDWG
jgi:hypothetical protein